MSNISSEAKRRAKTATDDFTSTFDPIKSISDVGFKSGWAYIGGFASIIISLASWGISRKATADDKAQSDRWGIFIGHWAPTFFALGIALKHEEESRKR